MRPPPPPSVLASAAAVDRSSPYIPDTASFLPGSHIRRDPKALTSIKHNKGPFVPGKDSLLGEEQPLPKELQVVAGLVEQAVDAGNGGGGGDGSNGGSATLAQALKGSVSERLRTAAARVAAELPSIAPVAAALAALTPEPSARLPLPAAQALCTALRSLRAAVNVGDEGLWVAVARWPLQAAARLQLGVEACTKAAGEVEAGERAAGSALEAVERAGSAFPARATLPAALGRELLPCLRTLCGGGGDAAAPRLPGLPQRHRRGAV